MNFQSYALKISSLIRQNFYLYSEDLLHRKILAYLMVYLEKYEKKLNQIDFTKRYLKQSDIENLQFLDELIQNLTNFIGKASKKNQINTLLEESYEQGVVFVEDFQNMFNHYVFELKMFENYVLPIPISRSQQITNELDDIQMIRNLINNELKTENHNSNEKNILRTRLAELDQTESELRKEQHDNELEKAELARTIEIDEFITGIKTYSKTIISYDDIEIQKKIGEGAEGIVYLSYQKSTRRALAVKKLNYQIIKGDYFEMIKRELNIVSNLDHFAILPFVGICTSPICMITEFMSGDSLFNRLKNYESPLSPTKLTIIALGIAHAIRYLHGKHLLHRDIKSLNVLLNSDDFPKLCDFGLSRFTDEPNDLHPGGLGTLNWMAPEVIKGFEYTEKSDVYSYGILLWEMLTGDTPYSSNSFTTEMSAIKIRDEVAYNNLRPRIPSSCSPRLEKLLKKCWAQDPKNRPDFNQIVEAFEKGEVEFSGTEPDQVKAYINQYEKITQNSDYLDIATFSAASMRNIAQDISNFAKAENLTREAVYKLNFVLSHEQLWDLVLQSDVIKHLILLIGDCPSSQLASLLSETVALIIPNENIFAEFEKENGCVAFLNMFSRFGTTSMPKSINVIKFILVKQINSSSNSNNSSKKELVFNANIFSKIAPFLLTPDLSLRLSTLKLVNSIVECFNTHNKNINFEITTSSFNSLARNALANIFPEAISDLIIESMTLIEKLMILDLDLDSNQESIINLNLPVLLNEGIIKVSTILDHNDEIVSKKAFELIETLLKRITPQKKTVKQLLAIFPILANNKNNEIMNFSLRILAYSLKSSMAVKKLLSKPQYREVIECFKLFFASKQNEVIINSLKLLFSFLYKSTDISKFIILTESLYQILETNNSNIIQTLLDSCFALIYKSQPLPNDSHYLSILEQHIKQMLSSKSIISTQILNLCGVISNSVSGAIFSDKIELVPYILSYMNYINNDMVSKQSILVLCSLSSLDPMCSHLNEAIPLAFDMIKKDIYSPYPLIFTINMSLTSFGAIECAKNIIFIIEFFDKLQKSEGSKIDTIRVLRLIERVISDSDAKKVLEKGDHYNELISLLYTNFQSNKLFYSILNEVAMTAIGKKTIRDSGILSTLINNYHNMKIQDESRPTLIKILSRFK